MKKIDALAKKVARIQRKGRGNGQILVANVSAASSGSAPSSPTSLEDLSDVAISSVATDQVLKWNGSAWVNSDEATESIYPSGTTGALVIEKYSDFADTSPYAGWLVDTNSNGAISNLYESPYTGIIQWSTGTNAAGRRHAYNSANPWRAVAGVTIKIKGRIQFNNQSFDGTNSFEATFGFANLVSGTPTYGAIFKVTVTTTTVAFQTWTRNNGTAETNTVTLPDSSTWATYEVVINGVTDVKFYIDGALVATHTTIPSGGAFGAAMGIRKTAGTTARLMKGDWSSEQVTYTSR